MVVGGLRTTEGRLYWRIRGFEVCLLSTVNNGTSRADVFPM